MMRVPGAPFALTLLAVSAVSVAVVIAIGFAVGLTNRSDAPIAVEPFERAGIRNVVTFHEGFYSGSAPQGDAGFDSLRALGIKTILSVDGAPPDLARIEARAMRSVHVPLGYDGFDDVTKAQLVRAVRDLPRPLYLHCHHGKHRSACASAAIAISLGWLTHEEAQARMKLAGTSLAYEGLWKCVARAQAMPAAQIDEASANYPRVTPPNSFVASMVAIDEAFDRVKALDRSAWTTPADDSCAGGVSTAARLADLFRVVGDPTPSARLDVQAMIQVRLWIESSAASAVLLESALERADFATASRVMTDLKSRCTECHSKYRD